MSLIKILVLACIQGAAELLPVSSSAHVIVAEKLMGMDPALPETTLLLVMLHTGTMLAVIAYFWKAWKESFFSDKRAVLDSAKNVVTATFLTGIVGLSLKHLIEKFFLGNVPHAEIELIFGNLALMSASLAAIGILILVSGWEPQNSPQGNKPLNTGKSFWIGAVQGVCLPFRGFSRSGATISTSLLLGVSKAKAEEFSFALAVVLTPPVIVREVLRLWKAHQEFQAGSGGMIPLLLPSFLGMAFSFAAGMLALKWLSNWLERGLWKYFGIYCLCASLLVFYLYKSGL